jgi:hypothetical protein
MAAYMSPEATENFKNSMRVGEIMAASFRRMFPNWDQMTEEQKRSVMNDSEIAGKIEAQRRFAEAEKVKKRTQADKRESARLESKYKVMSAGAAPYG